MPCNNTGRAYLHGQRGFFSTVHGFNPTTLHFDPCLNILFGDSWLCSQVFQAILKRTRIAQMIPDDVPPAYARFSYGSKLMLYWGIFLPVVEPGTCVFIDAPLEYLDEDNRKKFVQGLLETNQQIVLTAHSKFVKELQRLWGRKPILSI